MLIDKATGKGCAWSIVSKTITKKLIADGIINKAIFRKQRSSYDAFLVVGYNHNQACSSLLFCANEDRRPHIVYQSESGGVSLSTREIMLICCYAEEKINITQIIRTSFDIFLKKELQNVANLPCFTV